MQICQMVSMWPLIPCLYEAGGREPQPFAIFTFYMLIPTYFIVPIVEPLIILHSIAAFVRRFIRCCLAHLLFD